MNGRPRSSVPLVVPHPILTEGLFSDAPQGPPDAFEALSAVVEPLRRRLLWHPVYSRVRTQDDLRVFMESHVFAVWDFMSLVKRLQADLCASTIPWTPPADPVSARFINELVLGEESDLGPDGAPTSHLDAYLRAMAEVGASRRPIERVVDALREGCGVDDALSRSNGPVGAVDFSRETLSLAGSGSTVEVAATFLFGREDVIPEMFQRLLVHASADWGVPGQTRWFRWYLERHIEVDGDAHGPMAAQLLGHLCGKDPVQWAAAQLAAEAAIQGRLRLWDDIARRM